MKWQTGSFPSKITLSIGAVMIGIALFSSLLALQVEARGSVVAFAQSDVEQSSNELLDGAYAGVVELDWALSGVYSDTLPTPTPQPSGELAPILNDIDLGFLFHQVDGQNGGHVDLSSTLIFTKEHTIMVTPVGPTPGPGTAMPAAVSLAVGPAVAVSLNGADLHVESERFAMTTNAGQQLQRQFQLKGVADADNSHRFTGEYRETIWGFGPQPLTMVGKFTLVQPMPATSTATPVPVTPTPAPVAGEEKLYLPIVQK